MLTCPQSSSGKASCSRWACAGWTPLRLNSTEQETVRGEKQTAEPAEPDAFFKNSRLAHFEKSRALAAANQHTVLRRLPSLHGNNVL